MAVKLNLGSGRNPLEGFENLNEPEWKAESGLPYLDETIAAVTISHMLMYLPYEAWLPLFVDIERALVPGGVLRITEDDTTHADSSRQGVQPGALTATDPIEIGNLLWDANFIVQHVSPELSRWEDSSLIQHWHGDPPDVFHIEGQKPTEAFIHPLAVVEPGAEIGAGTRVWAFAHILGGAKIGRNCNICDHVFIENDVMIGNRVTVKCGVQLWDSIRIHDDVFIGPNATFTNDPMPRSGKHLARYPVTHVYARASIGANATILPGITIYGSAMVGAGSVVTRDVPQGVTVVGNPAKPIGKAP